MANGVAGQRGLAALSVAVLELAVAFEYATRPSQSTVGDSARGKLSNGAAVYRNVLVGVGSKVSSLNTIFYTSSKSWRCYIFITVCVCVCLSVCLCVCLLYVCLNACDQIPVKRMHRFGRGFC